MLRQLNLAVVDYGYKSRYQLATKRKFGTNRSEGPLRDVDNEAHRGLPASSHERRASTREGMLAVLGYT